MGATSSTQVLYSRLIRTIPPVTQMGWDEGEFPSRSITLTGQGRPERSITTLLDWKHVDQGMKAFVNDADREQFICSHSMISLFNTNNLLLTTTLRRSDRSLDPERRPGSHRPRVQTSVLSSHAPSTSPSLAQAKFVILLSLTKACRRGRRDQTCCHARGCRF
jgi:hypothetical protein